MIKTTPAVIIKASTWSKNSQSLSDFQSTLISEKTFETLTSTSLLRTEDEVFLESGSMTEQCPPTNFAQPLVCVRKNKDSFTVYRNMQTPADPKMKPEKIWQVVKTVNPSDLSYRGYILSEGDIIKLGKIKLRVRELRSFYKPDKVNDSTNKLRSSSFSFQEDKKEGQQPLRKHSDFIQTCNVEKLPEGGDFACRICLDSQDENNPLITPCACTGSVRHVHLECLKQWIESKCFTKDYSCSKIYLWRDLECELCHTVLPDVFLHEDKEIELLNIIRPTDSYIILETLPEKKQIKKVFYVARFTPDNKANLLKVGRKGDCEVKVNDLSVSRLHAMLRHFDGVFYLENGFSKFGTLVLFQKEFEITKKMGLSLQIGKTVLNFEQITKEILVEPEAVEEQSAEHINIPVQANLKPSEDELTQGKAIARELGELILRKISDASSDTILNSVESTSPSVSDLPSSLEDQGSGSAGLVLIDKDQIKTDMEYLDRLMESIQDLIQDRSKIMAEIEKTLVDPIIINHVWDWSSFEPFFAQEF